MKSIVYTIVLLFSLQFAQAADGISFANTTYDDAVQKAKSQGKLIFLDFTASWCSPCKRMERETFTNKSLGDYMNKNFVSFKVDNDFFWGMDIADLYDVKVLPTLLIVDGDGKVVKRITGFHSAELLLKKLQNLAN